MHDDLPLVFSRRPAVVILSERAGGARSEGAGFKRPETGADVSNLAFFSILLLRSHGPQYPKQSLADSPPLDTQDLARRHERAVHPRPRYIGEEREDVF